MHTLTLHLCRYFQVTLSRTSAHGAGRNVRSLATAVSTADLVDFGKAHVTKGLGRLTEAVMARGEGTYVNLQDGRRMLDFTCGIGVTNLGIVTFESLKVACNE